MNRTTSTLPSNPIDTGELRRALGTFLTGVTVVTCVDELGRPRGFTANSFTSVSLDPPLVLVCIAKSAESIHAFLGAQGIGVSILAEHQTSVSQLFASKSAEKFQTIKWSPGTTGAPRLKDGIAWFDCQIRQRVNAGDHVVLIGEVMRFSAEGGSPLGYCRGNYLSLGLADRAGEQKKRARTVFGCIVNDHDRVLFCRRAGEAGWTLPSTSLIADGDAGHRALGEILEQMQVSAELSLLFSVYEVADRLETHVFYRGLLNQPLPGWEAGEFEARLFGAAEIPWGDLRLGQTRSMLRRYLRENAAGSFGIYMDGFGSRRVVRFDGGPEERPSGRDRLEERPAS